MKNKYNALLILSFFATTAIKSDNVADLEKEITEKCLNRIDRLFWSKYYSSYFDASLEGNVKKNEELKYDNVSLGWFVGMDIKQMKMAIEELKETSWMNRTQASARNAAANRILKKIEQAYQENTKKLITEIPYANSTEQQIQNNYNKLVKIPYIYCSNGLRAEDTDCKKIHEEMIQFANEIINKRREIEPARG